MHAMHAYIYSCIHEAFMMHIYMYIYAWRINACNACMHKAYFHALRIYACIKNVYACMHACIHDVYMHAWGIYAWIYIVYGYLVVYFASFLSFVKLKRLIINNI